MAKREAGRVDGQFMVICKTPDVCKTPPLGTPVPYPIVGFLSDTVRQSPNVNFRGKPAKNMNSRVSTVTGDEAGAMGGVTSGVIKGFCRPITHSATVRVNGFYMVYDQGTEMWMNCAGPEGPGNTTGMVRFMGLSVPAQIGPDGPPPGDPEIVPEIPAEESFLGNLMSVEGIAGLAQMAPQLATMDWSNPAGVLGALGGVAGLGGLGGVAEMAGYASQAAGIIQDPMSAIGLLGPLGDMVGLPGSQLLGLAMADWSNPGSVIGAAGNMAGMYFAGDNTSSEPGGCLAMDF